MIFGRIIELEQDRVLHTRMTDLRLFVFQLSPLLCIIFLVFSLWQRGLKDSNDNW